jgi:uncharacterized protein (TIGR02246 family)
MKTFLNCRLVLCCCVVLAPCIFTCPARAAETKSSDEQALRDLDAKWSAAAAAKDVDKTVSYYADDAIVLPANATIATTRDAIRKVWMDLFSSPGAAVSWKTTKVEVAHSGDMGYTSGTYQLTMNDATGKPTADHGKYIVVWEKKAGTWKAAADIWNSDLPAQGSAPAPEAKP